jgi:TnpA family transposase
MARRRLLGDDLWARHLEPPTDERKIARHFTLTRDDLLAIASKRTAATRLGFALLLLYLRCPGRVLEVGEVPPDVVLAFVARQLGITARVFDDYAVRDSTRREHLAEIMAAAEGSATHCAPDRPAEPGREGSRPGHHR